LQFEILVEFGNGVDADVLLPACKVDDRPSVDAEVGIAELIDSWAPGAAAWMIFRAVWSTVCT
jgi:hypothetical protein